MKYFLNLSSLKNFQNWPALSGSLCIAEPLGVLFSCDRTLRKFKAKNGNSENVIFTSKKRKKSNCVVSSTSLLEST